MFKLLYHANGNQVLTVITEQWSRQVVAAPIMDARPWLAASLQPLDGMARPPIRSADRRPGRDGADPSPSATSRRRACLPAPPDTPRAAQRAPQSERGVAVASTSTASCVEVAAAAYKGLENDVGLTLA